MNNKLPGMVSAGIKVTGIEAAAAILRQLAASFSTLGFRLFFLLLPGLVLHFQDARAQQFGNEWINHHQQYVKIQVAQDSIYKITYQDLQQAGFPLSSVNPRTLQLYHRGREQAIYVEGEENNAFDPSDFILFYGKKNDGALDKELYISPDAQPHPYYNLYSDTTAYFLTFSLTNVAGKRMESFFENNTYNLAPEPYHLEEELRLFTNNYSGGIVYPYAGENRTYSTYGDYGEGYTGTVINNGQVREIVFEGLSQQVTNGPAPKLEVLLAGRNNIAREIDIQAGATTGSLQPVHTAAFSGAGNYLVEETLSWTQLSGGKAVVNVVTSAGERVSVSYARLTYARAWDMDGASEKVFHLPGGSSNRRYVEIKNVPENIQEAYDITSAGQVRRIRMRRLDATTVAAIIPDGETDRKIMLSSVQAPVPAVKKVKFRNINPSQPNYLIVSHSALRQQAGGHVDPVKAYGAYRASAAGGSFDTLVVNVGQLYDQFSYGEVTPLAIRRLVTYIAASGNPEYLFLLGKGLDVFNNYHRNANWTNLNRDLVPTFGWPGADIPYTARLNGSGEAPAFPVGRVGARTAEEVASYLNKVIEMEAKPANDLSRKNLVHLSGGSTRAQAEQFKRYLKGFENIAEGLYLGGKVETISKDLDVVVQEIDITKEVNAGVGLVTFFGHSAPNFSDMEIGYVSDARSGYNNKGKYPAILVNGCDAGNIFSTGSPVTFGEDWIFTADKGALNFIAHSGTGYTNLLRIYTDKFYNVAFADTAFIDASIGEIQQESSRRFFESNGAGGVAIAQVQQMVTQGDPAVKLFGRNKADYEVNNNSLFISDVNNQAVNLAADSIGIGIIIRNFGRVYTDSLRIRLNTGLNGEQSREIGTKSFPSPYYQDTLFYKIGTNQLTGSGLYRFDVQLNPSSAIPEINYSNNYASLEVVLNDGGTIHLLPQNFAISPQAEVNMFVQSTDPFRKDREYMLEIDTNSHFSSTALQQHRLRGDALLKHQVHLSEAEVRNDTLVYFWRTRLAQAEANEDTVWTESSFTFIPEGAEGWSQSHSGQFTKNNIEGAHVQEGRRWSFNEISRKVEVITFGPSAPDTDFSEAQLRIDDVDFIIGSIGRFCRNNSINAVHFEKGNMEPRISLRNGVLNSESCGRIPQIINNFIENDIINGNNDGFNLEKFLTEIPEGDYVVLFSIGNINYENWPASVKDQLISMGADPQKIASLKNGDPYILMGQKGGAAGTATEVFADQTAGSPAAEQTIQLEHVLEGKMQRASVSTELIGPAADWQELAYHIREDATDSYELQLIGVNPQMQEQLLFSSVEQGRIPLEVDAAVYPYLKLRITMEDGEQLTSPQLRYWQVLFTPLPEGVLLPGADLQKQYTLDEGQEFNPAFRFINITDKPFADSLQLRYSLFNHGDHQSKEAVQRIAAPAPNDTTSFNININTDSKAGPNDMKVEVNPRILPEMYYSNNLLDMKSYYLVRKDTIQPMVDVAFDGVYITNGAIVSPTPLITVLLRDENKHKFKQDTTGVYLSLKKECEGCDAERINLAGSRVRWQPATEESDFKIEFEPEALEDGLYTLQVQASDASGNKAGKQDYKITFEVITESTITKFYPYPNPFSTSTRFVFTVTGSEIPDDIKIQIMTVDGRVVREILKEELGPIRIGNNISNFAWDGRDEWGDQLANGIYLYKVYIRHSGEVFENRDTQGDKAFKQGFGKMYLLR